MSFQLCHIIDIVIIDIFTLFYIVCELSDHSIRASQNTQNSARASRADGVLLCRLYFALYYRHTSLSLILTNDFFDCLSAPSLVKYDLVQRVSMIIRNADYICDFGTQCDVHHQRLFRYVYIQSTSITAFVLSSIKSPCFDDYYRVVQRFKRVFDFHLSIMSITQVGPLRPNSTLQISI